MTDGFFDARKTFLEENISLNESWAKPKAAHGKAVRLAKASITMGRSFAVIEG